MRRNCAPKSHHVLVVLCTVQMIKDVINRARMLDVEPHFVQAKVRVGVGVERKPNRLHLVHHPGQDLVLAKLLLQRQARRGDGMHPEVVTSWLQWTPSHHQVMCSLRMADITCHLCALQTTPPTSTHRRRISFGQIGFRESRRMAKNPFIPCHIHCNSLMQIMDGNVTIMSQVKPRPGAGLTQSKETMSTTSFLVGPVVTVIAAGVSWRCGRSS